MRVLWGRGTLICNRYFKHERAYCLSSHMIEKEEIRYVFKEPMKNDHHFPFSVLCIVRILQVDSCRQECKDTYLYYGKKVKFELTL